MHNNLFGAELLDKFRDCIISTLDCDSEILEYVFKFSDYKGTKFKDFRFHRTFNTFYLNNVSLSFGDVCSIPQDLATEYAIGVILHNIGYNYFVHVDTKFIEGKRECYGHGEFFKVSKYIFYFHRYESK